MNKYYIYTLDYNGLVFYIGKSKNPKERLNKHIKESILKRTYKEKKINKIISNREDISISILDEVNQHNVDYWEIYWINQFRQWGFNLCNATSGGEGGDYWSGRNHTTETKKKLSINMYKQMENGFKAPVLKGELNGNSKLTSDQVLNMRKLREDGYSYNKLSMKFNVAKSTVVNIIKKKKWTHI